MVKWTEKTISCRLSSLVPTSSLPTDCMLLTKLACEKRVFHFPFINRPLSYQKSGKSQYMVFVTLVPTSQPSSNQRNYSTYFVSDRRTRKLTANCQAHNQTSFRNSNEAYAVLQSDGLQHWFKNWQELRRHRLTASTFGGAVGFWPGRRVRLWLEKLGAVGPFTGNIATCWNNIKEEEALERYKLITGNTISFPQFQVHRNKNSPEENWLAASPDGVVDKLVYGLPSRGVLEIKCPFFKGDMRKAFPWKRVPLYYIPQAQGLMEILDRDWMDFYVWTPKGSSLFRIYRDVEYWNLLKIALSDFWWKHVQPARELCYKYTITKPLTELRSLKPEPRHELCRFIVYDSKRVVDNSRLLVREIHGRWHNR